VTLLDLTVFLCYLKLEGSKVRPPGAARVFQGCSFRLVRISAGPPRRCLR